MASELLPCPFCGATGKDEIGAYLLSGVWRVCCLNCNTTIGAFTTKTEAIAAWNRRVPAAPAVPPDIAATIRAALGFMRDSRIVDRYLADVEHITDERIEVALAWLDAQQPPPAE